MDARRLSRPLAIRPLQRTRSLFLSRNDVGALAVDCSAPTCSGNRLLVLCLWRGLHFPCHGKRYSARRRDLRQPFRLLRIAVDRPCPLSIRRRLAETIGNWLYSFSVAWFAHLRRKRAGKQTTASLWRVALIAKVLLADCLLTTAVQNGPT